MLALVRTCLVKRILFASLDVADSTSGDRMNFTTIRLSLPMAIALSLTCLSIADGSTNDPSLLNPAYLHDVNDVTDVTDKFASERCLPFSDTEELGAWGEVVAGQISSGQVPNLASGPRDFKTFCPNYSKFNDTQKEELWVLVMTSMSHYESSCEKAVSARGPNGRAAGLLQLAAGKEEKYSAGCRRGDATNPKRALICGMAMLDDQVGRDGILFSDKSYWAVLRPHNEVQKALRIAAAVNSFAGCR